MKRWMHKMELVVDKLIPWLVGILFIVIIIEFFFVDLAEKYHTIISLLDGFIVFVFVLDLIFKYERAKNIPDFLRNSWLDIIAVFPFFLFFRFIEGFTRLFMAPEVISTGQKILHEGLLLEKESAMIVKEVEEAGKVSRTRFFAEIFKPRLLRPLSRVPRLVKILPFFEKPTGNHHIHER